MSRVKIPLSQDTPQINFATLDLLPYGIIVVNDDGTILYYNAREEQIACRKREDVIGKNFFTEVAPCTQVQEFHGRFRETMHTKGAVATFQFRFPFPDRPREVEISLTNFENDGALLCLISVSDATEENRLREHLIRAERLREVGEVAAGVAHNFNNLLTVVRGNAELMLRRLPEDDPLRKRVESILKASDDGAEMVRRIRESARQQPETTPATASVDLNEIVRDSINWTEDYAREAQAERHVRIEFEDDLAANLAPVRASASELREVFTNLLRNAVDAVSGEGRIRIESRVDVGGERNIVTVSDTGEGINAEAMEKLFRPLFTTKGERGTGLGLATCYAILRRHGGDIEVKSEVGKGTTFTVRLPAASK